MSDEGEGEFAEGKALREAMRSKEEWVGQWMGNGLHLRSPEAKRKKKRGIEENNNLYY